MDISALYNISSSAIQEAATQTKAGAAEEVTNDGSAFSSLLSSALDNMNTTNSYLSDAENEELKLSLGVTENTHDLTVALQKASTALQYTVAVRDRFLDAYKEIMQIQI